jgi:hypothetical protein
MKKTRRRAGWVELAFLEMMWSGPIAETVAVSWMDKHSLALSRRVGCDQVALLRVQR